MKIVTEVKKTEDIIVQPRADGKVALWKDGKSRLFFPIDAKGALDNGWSVSPEVAEAPEQTKEPEKAEKAVQESEIKPVVEEVKIETNKFSKKKNK